MQSVDPAIPVPGPQLAHAPAPQAEGRYRYTGGGWDNFALKLVNFLLLLVTCGLAGTLGYTTWRSSKYKVEHVTIDGEPLRYTASWGDEWGHHLLNSLLLLVTCGLAAPWVIAGSNKFRYSHATTADGRRLDFDGDGFGVLGLWLLTVFGLMFTLGFAWPWIAVAWKKWLAAHITVEDVRAPGGRYRLRFDAGGLAFLVQGILSGLLVQLTLGLYLPFAINNFERWAWASTSDELSPPLKVPMGPRTPAQWAVVFAAGAGFLAMSALILFAGIAAATASSGLRRTSHHDDDDDQDIPRSSASRSGTRPGATSGTAGGSAAGTSGTNTAASPDREPSNLGEMLSSGPHRWQTQTALTGAAAAYSMPCSTGADGSFSCQDKCGTNSGKIEYQSGSNEAVLAFTTVCSKAKDIRLTYRVSSFSSRGFRLERERDWQSWDMVAAPAGAADRPEGFPEEVPRSRTKPPTVKEWSESPTVKMEPEGCFRKVVREWMKLNCSKSEANHPHPSGFTDLSNYGTEYSDYFVWVRPPDVADVVVRMSPGRRGVATMQLEAKNLQVGYDWTDSGLYPKVVWE